MDGPTLEQLLRDRYQLPEWALVFEFSGQVGTRGIDRRADAVAFNCWPSKGWQRLAFEIKRTRADFMREVDTPAKRAWLEGLFHQCYFVVAPGIVKPDEVPEGWGLLVATKKGDGLRRTKAAQHREIDPLPEHLALSAIRALANEIDRARRETYIFEGKEVTCGELKARVDEQLVHTRALLERDWAVVRKLRQRLESRKQELEAPLSILARAAGEMDALSPWKGEPKPVTAEDIYRWLERVQARAVRGLLSRAKETHRHLGGFIEAVEAEGFEDGVARRYRPQPPKPLG